jgi:DNA-binding beta-propeller fold protein YncE
MNTTEGESFMKFSSLGRLAVGLSIVLVGAYALASPPAGSYHLIKKVPLAAAPGGSEYFDYITVDSDARRVYLTHGTEVKVVNADSGEVVGTVSGLKRCHGIALVKELDKGFITDSGAEKVVVFNIATLKVTGEIKTRPDADAIIYDPASKRIFSFNANAKDMTVIDPVNETVVKTLPMGGAPQSPVADGKGTVYDNNEDTNEVVVIDSRALVIKARWPFAPAGGARPIAMDRQHRRLFIGGRDPHQMLVVMDADNGKVIQSFPISAGADAADYDTETRMLFVSTREGMIHIFHEDSANKFSVVDTVKTEYGAKTMALDPKTHNLYLTTSDFGPPPAPTAEQPHPNPVTIPGTFRLLIYGR